jgi:hypothetical protein
MSLYEVLDRFVATGVLACAGLVGSALPPTAPLDASAFSSRVRSSRLNEPFGAALDALAHTLWFANERQGIPLAMAEHHASELTRMLGEVRFAGDEIARVFTTTTPEASQPPQPAGARLASAWLDRATERGNLTAAGLDLEISRFLLTEMLSVVVERTPLLSTLAPLLAEHRNGLAVERHQPPGPAAASPEPALSNLTRLRPVLVSPPADHVPATAPSAELQARYRIPEGAARRLQAILAQQPMSAEQRLARLDELGEWLISTVAYLRRQTNEPATQRQAKLDAAAALERGDFETAMERLKTVREHMREGRRRTEARIAEELQSLRLQMLEEAAATARLGELALARMDMAAAADHFADAAGQLPSNEGGLELEYRQKQAEALAARAESVGDALSLQSAVQAFRRCRSLMTDAVDPRLRTRINVGLGDMLVALGTRTARETAELEEAISAYADAVTGMDRASKPMQWALVQLSLAAALIELGHRNDRQRHWKLAASSLMPALDIFEMRGATDLAESARAKLRLIADALGEAAAPALLSRPA